MSQEINIQASSLTYNPCIDLIFYFFVCSNALISRALLIMDELFISRLVNYRR